MGTEHVDLLARQIAGYWHTADRHHRVSRMLATETEVLGNPGDGTVTLSAPYAAWQALVDLAAQAPPEPLTEDTATATT